MLAITSVKLIAGANIDGYKSISYHSHHDLNVVLYMFIKNDQGRTFRKLCSNATDKKYVVN